MSENVLEELTKRLNAKTIHELRQLGRALGVPHPADGKKNELLEEIIAVASAKKDSEPPTKRGAPPKSQEYDRSLASDILRCREIFLSKNLPSQNEKPYEIFVGSGDSSTLDYIGGGILECEGEEWFLRTAGCRENFVSDVFVNKYFVNTFNLREGDFVEGRCRRTSTDEMAGLASVLKVNGSQPDTNRLKFDELIPVYADKKLRVACGADDRTGRIIDLFAPIGAGQRALIASPHGCGKTQMLKHIAEGIKGNNCGVKLVIALIDVSPEEEAEFKKLFNKADVFTSSYGEGTNSHIRTMRLALEYGKRQTELGKDVVLIIDDVTRLTRAYNSKIRQAVPSLDYSAVDSVKKILASARNTEHGGSLTIISAITNGSGDIIEEAAYSALKDVCNIKITLSLTLSRARIYPPVIFHETFSIQDDRVLTERELQALSKLRETESEKIFGLLDTTDCNEQLVEKVLR